MNEQEVQQSIEKWKPYIECLATKWQNNIASKEDLISEGFLGVLRGINDFDPARSPKKDGFIFQCIKSQIICSALQNSYPVSCSPGTTIVNKTIRDEQTHKAMNTYYYIDDEDESLYAEDKILQQVDIEDFIEAFDPKQILKMHFIEGMGYKEISQKLNVSMGYISKYISRVSDLIWRELKSRR